MSSVDRGELFLVDLLRGQFEEAEGVQHNDNSKDDIVDDNATTFSSWSITSASIEDRYNHHNNCPNTESGSDSDNLHNEIRQNLEPVSHNFGLWG